MSSSPSDPSDLAVTPPLLTRAASGFGTSIVGGALVGAAAWVSDQLGFPLGLLLPLNFIGAWLALAFALGASARTVPTAALRGLVGLLSAVAVYYLLIAMLGVGFRAIGASHAATVWGAVALLAGPTLGAAGGLWRHGRGWPRALGVGLLAAALIAEGVVFGGSRWLAGATLAVDPGAYILAGEVIVGGLLPLALLARGERLRGYLATLAFGLVGVIAITPVTTLIRGLADRF